MKVTDVKTFTVDCFRTNWVFVKVYTDEGFDGAGEATLEYKEKALIGAVEHIRDYLVGKNPLDIEKHFHNIYRDAYWRGGAVLMSALSAVEMALWDILGKYLGVPVYQLLGGRVNDNVRIYVNGWFAGAKTPHEFAEKASIAIKRGVTALKWDPFGKSYLEISNKDLNTALECIASVREAVGNEIDLLIEGHGRYLAAKKLGLNKIPCIQLKELKEEEKKAYIIAHNKLTMNTGFDLEKLKAELEILKLTNIDLELTGFEMTELEDIMSDETELNLLPVEDTLDEDNSNKLEGLVCPCCGHKAKKKEFLECDIDG